MAPLAQTTRAELIRNFDLLLERTAPLIEGAALRGISVYTLRRMITRGEVEPVLVGRDIRVWR
jgi:hypothetical protein